MVRETVLYESIIILIRAIHFWQITELRDFENIKFDTFFERNETSESGAQR